MKNMSLKLTGMVALVVNVLFGFALALHAGENLPVLRITTEREMVKSGKGMNKTYSGVCLIKIQNISGIDASSLVVKCVVLQKDLKTRAPAVSVKGEKRISLKPLQTAIVRTDGVELTTTETRTTTINRSYGYDSAGGRIDTSTAEEHVDLSGDRYLGIAVAVYLDGERITTYYDNNGVQAALKKLDLAL